MCANNGQSEVYGYKWKWEDGEIQEQEVRSKLDDFRKRKVESFRVSHSRWKTHLYLLNNQPNLTLLQF